MEKKIFWKHYILQLGFEGRSGRPPLTSEKEGDLKNRRSLACCTYEKAKARANEHAVNSDGTNLRLLRKDGLPIGYAADNALMIMRMVQGRFEVAELGANGTITRVVLADAAPGAIVLCDPGASGTMCDRNSALAPYRHALIVSATYTNGSRKLWSDDLITGKQCILLTPESAVQVQLPGWDRLPV